MMKRYLLVVLTLLLLIVVAGCSPSGGTSPDSSSRSKDSDSDSDSSATSAPKPDEGTVQVALSWDEPVDVDLEVWDEDGQEAVTSAGLVTDDVKDGEDGDEYVDFVEYDEQDLSAGDYVISVYFAEDEGEIESTNVKLIVTKADGTTDVRTRKLLWEKGKDQWHAFSIDARTGDIEDIDQLVETVTEE